MDTRPDVLASGFRAALVLSLSRRSPESSVAAKRILAETPPAHLLQAAGASLGGHLDSAGRWFLAAFDYRVQGLSILIALLFFASWRRLGSSKWPTRDDFFRLLFGLIACIGGITISVVFLLTKPPAIEMLSSPLLLLLGLGVPILIFGEAIPKLKALLFPREVHRPWEVKAGIKIEGRERAGSRERRRPS